MKGLHFRTALIISPLLLYNCAGNTEKKIPNERPNILIAMGDDISFPHMGAYGTSWVKTPGFDRVAANGLLFSNAYTPNAKSSPSRACFLTGRNSWQLEEAANHIPFFPVKFKSFMEALGENGYYTGCTAKGWAPGIAVDTEGKARQLTGKAFNTKKLDPPTAGISNNNYSANFEDFLNSRSDNKPFCFWYGSLEPHRGYEKGSGLMKGGKNLSEIGSVPGFWPDNELVRGDMLDYAFEIEHFDSHLVRMLEILEEKGELDNTIVIVTADNGMPFPRAKGQSYEYSNHMPLAIMWGRGIKNPGREIYDMISFIDIAPTVMELAGITPEASGMQPMEGNSFTDIFSSGKKGIINDERNWLLIGKERHDVGRPDDAGYPIRGIVREGFLYLINFKPNRWPAGDPGTGYMNCDASPTKSWILNLKRSGVTDEYWDLSFGLRGGEELYDLGKDPDCMINLAQNTGYNTLRQQLRDRLTYKLEKQDDPRIKGNGDIFDRYIYADERTRDFYNRFMRGELSRKSASWIDSTDFEVSR